MNNIQNSEKIVQSFSVFRSIYQEIIQTSSTFERLAKEQFSSLNRVSILAKRREGQWEQAFLLFNEKTFSLHGYGMILISRRYVWEYDNVADITTYYLSKIRINFSNGHYIDIISSYTEFISDIINRNKSITEESSDDFEEFQTVSLNPFSKISGFFGMEEEVKTRNTPRAAQFQKGILDPEYLIFIDTKKQSLQDNSEEDMLSMHQESQNMLTEIKSLSTKLVQVSKLINEELGGQIGMLDYIDQLVDANIANTKSLNKQITKL